MNFNILPSLVALAILVVVFEAILRQGAAERLHPAAEWPRTPRPGLQAQRGWAER